MKGHIGTLATFGPASSGVTGHFRHRARAELSPGSNIIYILLWMEKQKADAWVRQRERERERGAMKKEK